jgi:hypothetical protein
MTVALGIKYRRYLPGNAETYLTQTYPLKSALTLAGAKYTHSLIHRQTAISSRSEQSSGLATRMTRSGSKSGSIVLTQMTGIGAELTYCGLLPNSL